MNAKFYRDKDFDSAKFDIRSYYKHLTCPDSKDFDFNGSIQSSSVGDDFTGLYVTVDKCSEERGEVCAGTKEEIDEYFAANI